MTKRVIETGSLRLSPADALDYNRRYTEYAKRRDAAKVAGDRRAAKKWRQAISNLYMTYAEKSERYSDPEACDFCFGSGVMEDSKGTAWPCPKGCNQEQE